MIFQFPSGKYEIIELPILPAKWERQRNTTAKSSVCCTGNKKTSPSPYRLITEINLEVDTETLMDGGERGAGENRHQSQKSFKSFPMYEFGNTSQCKVEQPMLCYLNLKIKKEINRSRRFFYQWKSILILKSLKYLVDEEHFYMLTLMHNKD